MKIILASSSIYRKMLLKQIHLPFETISPEVDEEPIKKLQISVTEKAMQLSELKGLKVAHQRPEALVIASDQIAHFNGKILSKPQNFERAFATLKTLQGQTHELVTSLWMKHPNKDARNQVVIARLKMRPLSDDEIATYLHLEKPFDCAGAYKWEGAGNSLIESFECTDPNAIIGLPLLAVTQNLLDWNLPLPFMFSQSNQESTK